MKKDKKTQKSKRATQARKKALRPVVKKAKKGSASKKKVASTPKETLKRRKPKTAVKKRRSAKSRFKNKIREILFQMRKELIEDVSESIKTESDDLRFDVGDFYDHATSDRARELSLMLTDRERQKLIQIEEALKKIDEGSYGVCESCGEEIDAERLLAMPFAKLCLSCKIDLESQENL